MLDLTTRRELQISIESGSSALKRSQTTKDQINREDNAREKIYDSQAGILMEPSHCYIHPSKLDSNTKNTPSAAKVRPSYNKIQNTQTVRLS